MKDMTTMPALDFSSDHDMRVLVDVDYYVDMPQFLGHNLSPVLLYTFQPRAAAGICEDFSFTFLHTGQVQYQVTGGGSFQHHLWNYSLDHLTATSTFCGIPYSTTTYLVDRRPMSQHHELVLLTPILQWRGIFSLISRLFSSKNLLPLNPVVGDFARLEVHSHDGHFISTARLGQYAVATVPVVEDNTIANLMRVSKHEVTTPTVEANIGIPTVEPGESVVKRQSAVILLDYHRNNSPRPHPVIYPVVDAVRRYQYGNFDESAKPSLHAYMSPLLHECFAPDQTLGNEVRGVEGRILDVRSSDGSLPITPFLHKVIDEFVERLIPIPHVVVPFDMDAVYDKQDRPSQRRILDDSSLLNPIRLLKVFMKAEAYSKPADPRLISTINGVDKAAYSMYTYALSAYLKDTPWYAFGRTPAQIAQRVTEVCSDATTVTKSDFNRLDGTISPVLRQLERTVLARAFPLSEMNRLDDLHRSQYHLRAICRKRTKYNSKTARGSGSPETSIFNSIDNAFATYLTHRMTRIQGSFLTPDEAWSALNRGTHGGDDGLNPDIDVPTYLRATASIGLRLKAEAIPRGQLGIVFLSRVYGPAVWTGDPNSCADLPRQLSKIHTTTVMPSNITPAMKLSDKVRSYILSDAHTPVLGPFCQRAIEILDAAGVGHPKRIKRWHDELPPEVQYPNYPADWMYGYAHLALPHYDFDAFEGWLHRVHSVDALLQAPTFAEPQRPRVAIPVVVNHERIDAAPAIVPPTPAPVTHAAKRSRDWRARKPKERPATTHAVPNRSGGRNASASSN
jgi:hypothetical protein